MVVIAGEDGNDRQALRVVLEAACPEMRGRLVEIKDSVRLRQATGDTLTCRVSALHRKALARAEREQAQLACLFVHEDWDGADSDRWQAARLRVQKALENVADRAHYVLAVWETEAWLLLFPDAVQDAVSSWSVPAVYRGRDTGRLPDPKKIMKSECAGRNRNYRESDAVEILGRAVESPSFDRPDGTNRSWTSFREAADVCCGTHLARSTRT